MKLTCAQAIVKFLANQYVEVDGVEERFVKGFFTLFGHGNVLGLGQALYQNKYGFDVYQGKNEQGMAHAAIAYSKQKLRRQIFAVTSSVGPGAANMVAAAGTATANNIPVLILPGDVHASRQPDPVLQQVEHTDDLSISTNDAFRAVSKYFDRINRPEQIMTALISAMRVLTNSGDTGAVTIALPQDVQAEAYDYPDYFFEKRVHRMERPSPTPEMLSDAVELIKSSKKPFIVCGGGVRYSGAGKALDKFCSSFNIPFGETQAGKSAVVFDNPYNMGGVGVTGGAAANHFAKDADLVIGIGTRFTDFTTASKQLFQNKNVRFLNINTSVFHAGKLDGVKVVADAKAALKAITAELEKLGYRAAYGEEIKEIKDKWIIEQERLFNTRYTDNFVPEVSGHLDDKIGEYVDTLGSCLTQTEVLGELQKLLDDGAVVTGSSGSLPGCMQRIWNPKETETYNMEYGYSCMGYEICGAFGVKLAEPEREVYAMVGDGSYLMLHSELVTSIQENKKINVILFDNSGFGCINNLQMSNGIESFGTEFRENNDANGKIMYIDYAKSASGYGAKTYTVKTIEQLREAVEDAKKQKVSTLIDIKVLPKTMTDGYDAWWHVGVAEVSEKKEIAEAYENKEENLKKARRY